MKRIIYNLCYRRFWLSILPDVQLGFVLGFLAGALWLSLPWLDFMNNNVAPLLEWAIQNGFGGFGVI